MRFSRRLVTAGSAALAACGLLLTAGCAEPPLRASASKPVYDDNLHQALPAGVLSAGELRVVTDASYPPASSFAPDGRTIVGFEPDLARALGTVLGVRVTIANKPFDGLRRLVADHRADLVMSAMTDTAQRERDVDFVNYFSAGTSIVVKRGNPLGITDLDSLCGLTVAVQAGTVQVDLLKRSARQCGNQPLKVSRHATNDDALLQLRTGRAAAVMTDYAPATLLTTAPRTSPYFQMASTAQYEPGLYGIGVAKDLPTLRNAVQGALQELIDTGTYTAILRTWRVSEGAVTRATVDGGAANVMS